MQVNMNFSHIYKILDPRDNSVIYVGKSDNIFERIGNHISNVKSPIGLFIQQLILADLKPIFVIIEQCHKCEVDVREIFWIYKYKNEGCNLLNQRIDKFKSLKYELRIEL